MALTPFPLASARPLALLCAVAPMLLLVGPAGASDAPPEIAITLAPAAPDAARNIP